MTTEELYQLVAETLARMLAERVMEKLVARQKRALVVYTGSNIGVAPALESMRRLKAEGFTFRVLMSRSAARILDTDAIRAALEPEEFWVDQPGDTPEALTARYDTIVVPALTVHTAAHVASCMADTPAAAVILDGLMRGKNVIAAVDGCCPDNSERAARGFHMAPPLKQRLRDNIETLRSYGAHVTTADQLWEKTMRAVQPSWSSGTPAQQPGLDSAPQQSAPRPEPARSFGHEVCFEGKLLSVRNLIHYPSHTVLRVPRDTMVTQFAIDEARRRGIQIHKES